VKERVEVGRFLVADPEISHGRLTFKGTRVPVHTVLIYLAKGYSADQLLEHWPQLCRPAIDEAIRLAADALIARHEPGTEVAVEASG
jgi:uncharacterized protein (DUF433 family)